MGNLRENIKKQMKSRGWTAYDLEKASGVSQPTIHRFLTGGHQEIREKTVKKLAYAFNKTEAELRGIGGVMVEQGAGNAVVAERTDTGISLIKPGQKKAPVIKASNQTANQLSELIRVIGDGNLSADDIQLLITIAKKFNP